MTKLTKANSLRDLQRTHDVNKPALQKQNTVTRQQQNSVDAFIAARAEHEATAYIRAAAAHSVDSFKAQQERLSELKALANGSEKPASSSLADKAPELDSEVLASLRQNSLVSALEQLDDVAAIQLRMRQTLWDAKDDVTVQGTWMARADSVEAQLEGQLGGTVEITADFNAVPPSVTVHSNRPLAESEATQVRQMLADEGLAARTDWVTFWVDEVGPGTVTNNAYTPGDTTFGGVVEAYSQVGTGAPELAAFRIDAANAATVINNEHGLGISIGYYLGVGGSAVVVSSERELTSEEAATVRAELGGLIGPADNVVFQSTDGGEKAEYYLPE